MTTVDKTEIKQQVAASIKNFSLRAKDDLARSRTVVELPEFIKNKAALISAHFLLPAGSRIVDMSCETGEVTYSLALLNPRNEIIGVDTNPDAIEFARRAFRLPNLSFRLSDNTVRDLDDESVDAIINSNVLHRVYSDGGYNPDEAVLLMEKQIRKLKVGGTMLIRDYMMPPREEFVLLELPNIPSKGYEDPEDMSDADLLVHFSQMARPIDQDCEGFFIEELPPRREGTRLFRLLHKWALEFIHRKDSRKTWDQELTQEYTFATYQDYQREFGRLGMRMVYSAPYWNPWVVKNCFKGRFQLYTEDYKSLGYPATNYFIVSQKVADKQSLVLEERRPSQKPVGDLQIMVVRDKKTGALHELVKRPGEHCDVVPYRITADNRLVVYVRSGYPRPIVNAVSRGGYNIDGKKWSGHLIEPITMDTVNMGEDVEENRKAIFDFVRSYGGLRPKRDDAWYVGETYFPAPDRIDEAIEPVFVEVENPQKTTWNITSDRDVRFTEVGTIKELDGADIILASQVGLLPDPRLELHVFDLMSRHNIAYPRWIGETMPKLPGEPTKPEDPNDILAGVEPAEFKEEKRSGQYLRPVKAVFVEEGKVGRGTRGLSAQDVEFIVTEDGIENVAIVVPISRDWDNNLLVALDPTILPVPNRLGGDGVMLNAPSFPLPRDVRTVDDARSFVADKFKVPVEQVAQLGESYFTHTGVTPQRIYPFVVSSPADAGTGPKWRYAMVKSIWKLWGFARFSGGLLKAVARMQMAMDSNNDMGLDRSPVNLKNKGFSLSTEKQAVESKYIGYSGVQSRILGQRGATGKKPEVPAPAAATPATVEVPQQPPRPRLMERYAQAKSGSPITVKETPVVQKMDQNIDAVAEQLKKIKEKPEFHLPDPKPR